MGDELRARPRGYLEARSTLALATVNADGTPAIAHVFFVVTGALDLSWLSSPTTWPAAR